jgi:hypothetical protein
MRRGSAGSFAPVLVAVAALGCASSYDPASKLKALRVLAVQKDKPYAKPGDTVHLQMLVSDPRSREIAEAGGGGTRDLSVAWLNGCKNPPGDSYQLCTPQLIEALTPPIADDVFRDGTLDFSLTLHPKIISDRAPPANPAQPRFGTAFVFFAACAGKLSVRPTANPPFACVSDSGKTLGADDFVLGYTEIFAYEELTNQNPIIGLNGAPVFEVDGTAVEPDCIGEACVALAAEELALRPPISGASSPDGGLMAPGVLDAGLDGVDGGTRDAGTAPPSNVPPPPSCDKDDTSDPTRPADPRCFNACTSDDENKCPKHTINLVVDESSAEPDDAAEAIAGRKVLEQMWINYYADQGKLEHDVKLLNDATSGWNPEHAADLLVPKSVGSFHVWAVAHDNRGGAQWVRVTLATRSSF